MQHPVLLHCSMQLSCFTCHPQATEYHLGQLKAKLAKLRTELQAPAAGGKGGGDGFEVQKYGDGRVALIGGWRWLLAIARSWLPALCISSAAARASGHWWQHYLGDLQPIHCSAISNP
jgi:hypothetical protein